MDENKNNIKNDTCIVTILSRHLFQYRLEILGILFLVDLIKEISIFNHKFATK